MTRVNTSLKLQPGQPTAAVSGLCPACGIVGAIDFLHIDRIPANVGSLCASHVQAIDSPMGQLDLVWCPHCDFIHNRSFDGSLIHYEPGYDAGLYHSAVFRTFVDDLIGDLIERHDLRGKHIIEIGCGSGWFLRRICELGGNHGVGFDPCVKDEGTYPAGDGSIRLVRDCFTDQYRDLPCDLLVCLDVIEAIPNPQKYLREIREMLGDRKTTLFFESPNTNFILKGANTFSLYYEAFSLFTQASKESMFRQAGFNVTRSGECYVDGQYIFVEADTQPAAPFVVTANPNAQLPDPIAKFADAHRRAVATWTNLLGEFTLMSRRAVTWGAGGKGIGFVNALDPDGHAIDVVVDTNEAKREMYIPGSGHRVVSPKDLVELRPEVIIITNPLYAAEIKQTVAALGLACEFHTV